MSFFLAPCDICLAGRGGCPPQQLGGARRDHGKTARCRPFWDEQGRSAAAIECLRTTLRVAPDYTDAMFNLALLLQRTNQYAEAADYWRRYLGSDCQSEWASRARRSLKFCEMQVHLSASA
jgi:tetratricopeptide (TPR) repeat protein